MAEVSLQRPRIVALVGQGDATGVPQHVRVNLDAGKPAVVRGEPRSLVNTNGEDGFCSRCSRRSARISSPTIGCVAGVPSFASYGRTGPLRQTAV